MAEKTLREHLRDAVRRRWKKATVAEKHANGSHAAKAFWAGKSAEERSTIMKARAAKRQRNRKRKP